MSKIEDLIAKYCPDGVEYKSLNEVCVSINAGGDLPENYRKGQTVPSQDFPYPIYSNGTESNSLYGFTDNFKINTTAVTISARGTIGYHCVREPKFTPIVRLIVLIPNSEVISAKFLNYGLSITEIGSSGGSIPQLTVPNVKKIIIPVPPLPVQEEIVSILDKFTALEAELEAELEARTRQYEYYRNELLSFEGKDVEWKALGEVCKISNGKDHKHLSEGKIPVFGSGGIMRYANDSIFDKESVLIPRKGSIGNIFYVNEPFWTVDTIFYTKIDFNIIKAKFLFYYLKTLNLSELNYAGGVPSLTKTILDKIIIPVPPIEKQERIVAILDKFDALVNDISTGLPAEIQARRQQYEYYRGKLLTFEPLTA